MNKFYHSIYLNGKLCKGCFNCIKRCPTEAIRVHNGKAIIIKEFCTDCGECIRQCPYHAKLARRDTLDVLEKFEYTVALPTPTLYAQFNNLTDVNIVLSALKQMGFNDVFEVAGAAEIISEESRRYVQENDKKWPIINNACPAVERLIRVRFPNLLENLLPIIPPMELAAKLARQKALKETGLTSEQIGIIYISPCPAKITFPLSPLGITRSEIDASLSIKDIYPVLLSHMKHVESHIENLACAGKIGLGWELNGGEAAGIFTENYLAADGIENCIRVLEDLEDQKFNANLEFIELNACNAGCAGGVLNVENPYVAKTKLKQLKKYMPVSISHQSDYACLKKEDLYFTEAIQFEPVYQLGSNFLENMESLNAMEKLLKTLPGMDCGSCGAPTCRAFAEDVIRFNAKEYDCIYRLKDHYDQYNNENNEIQKQEGKL